jgi:hypothetical protein
MALILLQPGTQPLGQFDSLDADVTTWKGGEVATWGTALYQGPDLAAADVNNDGYVGTTTKNRVAIIPAATATARPLFLTDDGVLGYGTLFGEIVGATTGQQSVNGVVLGPSTTAGSGKVTLWDKPGLYGVSLDNVDTAANGLVPASTAGGGLTVGAAVSYTATGLLTPATGGNPTTSGGTAPVIARLAEFAPKGSLVTTPNTLVAALNSPSGDVSSLQQAAFYMAVIWYGGASGSGV